jgi:hypothetical protein
LRPVGGEVDGELVIEAVGAGAPIRRIAPAANLWKPIKAGAGSGSSPVVWSRSAGRTNIATRESSSLSNLINSVCNRGAAASIMTPLEMIR